MKTTTKGKTDRAFYADQVSDAWRQVIGTIRTLGYTLISSRIDLPPDDWRTFITEDCPFDLARACRLIKVAQSQQGPGLTGTFNFCEVIRLEEQVFRFGVERDLIGPSATSEEVKELKKKYKLRALALSEQK
ncbi:MAG: hypothetical protein ABL967_09005 [Bryobacteraceae bacterium]